MIPSCGNCWWVAIKYAIASAGVSRLAVASAPVKMKLLRFKLELLRAIRSC
jgi:hypothetical protein